MMSDNVKNEKVKFEVLSGVVGQETKLHKVFRKVPPMIMLCMAWLLFMFIVAVFWEQFAPFDFEEQDLANRLSIPKIFGGTDTTHFLGTDSLGRDFLSRLIRSIRTSLLVAFCGTIITAVLGTTLGFVAAHFRGWVDETIMMLVDFQYSLPFMNSSYSFSVSRGGTNMPECPEGWHCQPRTTVMRLP